MIVAVWLHQTALAVAAKFAVVALAGTVTEFPTVNAELLSESVTFVPPDGATADNVTVQVELAPAASVVGVHASFVTVSFAVLIVSVAVVELPFNEAVIVAV